MNREYHAWFSPNLQRTMELLVFGHAGEKVLIFPTRDGRFHEYEDLRVVEALRPWVDSGALQLICLDNIAHESLYCFWCKPQDRFLRYLAFERYVLDEVLPWLTRRDSAHDPAAGVVAHGLSMGAFFAANFALRHPAQVQRLVAFSGRYDLTRAVEHFGDLLEGHYDETVYFNTPLHFLPGLCDESYLNPLRKMKVTLAVGDEDPFLEQNQALASLLEAKGVYCELFTWHGRAHRGGAWRRMAPHYLPSCAAL
ncbi:MAG: alpha/beta hydrolase-fold protein [Pseudomonadota bacterium]